MTEASASSAPSAIPPVQPLGLTSAEARQHLASTGANTLPDDTVHAWRIALKQLWAPVPWMLEGTIVLELVLGKNAEAAIIAVLLAFNAGLGMFQQGRAQATLAALRSRLALTASVRRDSEWKTLPAAEVVPGDVVKLSLGRVVPADVRLTEGSVLIDQSMLTGESVPVEAGPGLLTYAGALIRRGEAVAEVIATGERTRFGRTAALVRTAHASDAQQKAVISVVSYLALFNGSVIVVLALYARHVAMPLSDIVSLVLTGLLASIPVALPATFTLAAALGARALAKVGVLPTRLSAVDEAATMDVLCVDKTGTLTLDALSVSTVRPMAGFTNAQVLSLAAMASADGGQDPLDAAIVTAARASEQSAPAATAPRLIKFTPFDPASKMSEATFGPAGGAVQRVVKGAPAVILAIAAHPSESEKIAAELEGQGFRVLAVASGAPTSLKLVGFIALSDPPRPDSGALITQLSAMGVRTLMATGDSALTAASVAHAVGLDGPICPPGAIPATLRPETYAVFAGVLPEDKFKLVQTMQESGHTVGMCGDGANDAPALRQAQMGIAVSTATDVAKSAAGMVLTSAGLAGILSAIKEGRVTFQRIQTYTLNSITSKILQVMLLTVGLLVTGQAILTPMLMVIIMITGDFLGMSLTTDHVRPSLKPNVWRIGRLSAAGAIMGIGSLVFCCAVLGIGDFAQGYDIDRLRTLAFVAIVFVKQATTYTNRERRHLWSSRPSTWLVASSVADVAIASTLAVAGIAMTALPVWIVAETLGAAAVFAFVLDAVKLPALRRLGIQ
jgi:H+-transporting ATPase